MKSVAVVYLARVAHGIDAFLPFANSYRNLPAEYPHDLILIGKGMTKPGERAATELVFSGIPHNIVQTSDDGFDIHAYLELSKKIPHEYILFCNTYTIFVSAGWLRKMMAAAETNGVGLVGTTGSYESLIDSLRFTGKAVWLTAVRGIRFSHSLADQFEGMFAEHAKPWLTARKSLYMRIRREVGDRIKRRPKLSSDELNDQFEDYWSLLIRPGGVFHSFSEVSRFPNPHVRSNTFLIKRELLNSFDFNVDLTKQACNLFESGPEGMPKRIERAGLEQVVVGADGRAYLVEDWPKSRTFRLGQKIIC